MLSASHTLVCCRWGIGDCVMTVPAYRALRRHRAGDRFTWVIAEHASTLTPQFAATDDEVVTYHGLGLTSWLEAEPNAAVQALLDRLPAPPYLRVVDALHAPPPLRDALLCRGVDRAENDQGVELDRATSGVGPESAVAASAEVDWGVRVAADDHGALRLGSQHDDAAARALADAADAQPLALATSGGSPLKVWPATHLAELIRCLREAPETSMVPVVLLAGLDPDPVADHVVRATGLRRIPPTDLPVTAALLRRCRGLVSNDTGLLHLAAAVRTPIVGVFGPTSPRLYLPRCTRSVAAEPPDEARCLHREPGRMGPPDCIVRGVCARGGRSCIDSVEPRAVFEQVRQMLQR